jgi:hypothetical protein
MRTSNEDTLRTVRRRQCQPCPGARSPGKAGRRAAFPGCWRPCRPLAPKCARFAASDATWIPPRFVGWRGTPLVEYSRIPGVTYPYIGQGCQSPLALSDRDNRCRPRYRLNYRFSKSEPDDSSVPVLVSLPSASSAAWGALVPGMWPQLLATMALRGELIAWPAAMKSATTWRDDSAQASVSMSPVRINPRNAQKQS